MVHRWVIFQAADIFGVFGGLGGMDHLPTYPYMSINHIYYSNIEIGKR